MNMDGRVVLINEDINLAAIDLGLGQALVVRFPLEVMFDVGDLLQQLTTGYQEVRCVNVSKAQEITLQTLSGAMPMSVAILVVGCGQMHRLEDVA
ncbi:hypothetical protein P886_3519 [Alteromonadaceae bacterium 2753L.S.0a.02]|nr:hypothetical protein P886_3519 [Alteromonadaceae bacterium 2753L.S.0a.02]